MEPLRTYDEYQEAVRAARVTYDHSKAKMVTKGKTVRKSRKAAFLTSISTVRSRCSLIKNLKKSSVQRQKSKATCKCPDRRPTTKNDQMLQIFIKTPLASTVCLQLKPSTTILDLKSLLQDRLGIDAKKQQLVTMKNFELFDLLSLEDHGIQKDTNLEMRLVTGLMGGMEKSTSEGGETDAATAGQASSSNTYNITNLVNCPIFFGPATDNTLTFATVPATVNVTKDGSVDDDLTKAAFHMLKLIMDQKGKQACVSLLSRVFNTCDADLAQVELGSLKFLLHVKSKRGLDKLWAMFTSGELSKKLTDILITEELTPEDKSCMAIQVEISQHDYKEACIFFEDLSKDSSVEERSVTKQADLPASMSDWTKEHVRCWLLSIGVAKSIVDYTYREEITGQVLKMYTKEHLREDFSMTVSDVRLILYSRERWLESKSHQSTTPSSTQQAELDSEERTPKGAAFISANPNTEMSPRSVVKPVVIDGDEPQETTNRSKTKKSKRLSRSRRRKKWAQVIPDEVEGCLTQASKKEVESSRTETPLENPEEELASEPAACSERSPGGEAISQLLHESIETLQPQENNVPLTPSFRIHESPPDSPKGEDLHQVEISRAFVSKTKNQNTAVSQTVHISKTQESRLRMLLTGDGQGELDQSFYPILVANKPTVVSSEHIHVEDELRSKFEFMKTIKWTAVFDFNPSSLENGLCKLYHDARSVTLQLPEFFKHGDSEEELKNSIDFPEKTLWIFANGREESLIEAPKMAFPVWHRERRKDVDAAVTFFSQPSVIPNGRQAILLLVLSDDDIDIMCELFGKITSSFQDLQRITCIFEDQSIYATFLEGVKKWFSKDEIDQRSVVGVEFTEINRIMMRMKGVNQTSNYELPFGIPGKQCFLSEKQRDEWDDLTVVCKNECENTDMDETNLDYEKFTKEKELHFYRGGSVDWWNFAIGEKEVKRYGCGHVLKRKGFGDLLKKVTKPLNSSKSEDSLIVSVLLLHQPGAGGSTLARYVVWELHKMYRCVIVNRVTENTVNQIMEVRQYGYDRKATEKNPPVCVLVDNLDTVDLVAELEEVSKDIPIDGGAVCVLMHCKRFNEPDKVTYKGNVKYKDKDLKVTLTQKLEPDEKQWFQKKQKELEREEKFQTGEYKLENLLAFMVMKEEANPMYIQTVVSGLLSDIKENEFKLIKYCAFLNYYRPDAAIPVSCCDSMMDRRLTLSKLPAYLSRKGAVLWEHAVSSAFETMVIIENKEIKMINSVAKEALKQTRRTSDDRSLAGVALEFLKSGLLSSWSHSKKDLEKRTHDLLVRRKKFIYGDETQTEFSLLVEDLYSEDGPEMAFKVLETGFEKLQDAFVAQQLARLYLREKDIAKAHIYADKALEINSTNSYFLDTKGRVFKANLRNVTAPFMEEQQVLVDDRCNEIISLSFAAMDIFRKSYNVSKEALHIVYTGLYAEVEVAFKLLQIIHKCVEPFRTKGEIDYLRVYLMQPIAGTLTKLTYPKLSKQCHDLLMSLKERVDCTLEILDDTATFCKDSSSAHIAQEKLDEIKNNLREFYKLYVTYYGEPQSKTLRDFVRQDPKSVAECRRRQVQESGCSRFQEIFRLAQENDHLTLGRCHNTLLRNSDSFNSFDLRNLVLINLAMSSIGAKYMAADDVYQQFVRPLNKLPHRTLPDCWPPFFMMMFLWPIQDIVSERKDKHDLTFYIEQLNERWDIRQTPAEKRGQEKRHSQNKMKPSTRFFLGQGRDLRAFVHIHELHGNQRKLEKRDANDDFWQSSNVRDRLVRLEGFLLSKTQLQYSLKKSKIKIRLAVPSRRANQESVTFYLGFSWIGPVAYAVTPKGRENYVETTPSFHEAYPHLTVPNAEKLRITLSKDFSKVDKLQDDCRKLREELNELVLLSVPAKEEQSRRAKAQELKRKLDKTKDRLRKALEKDSYDDDL